LSKTEEIETLMSENPKFRDPAIMQRIAHFAARSRNLDLLEQAIARGADINEPIEYGNTIAHLAARQGDLAMLKFAVEHGADLDAVNSTGATLMHAAAYGGSREVVEYLAVEKGMNVNTPDLTNYTPMEYALISTRDDPSVLQFLIDKGAVLRKGERLETLDRVSDIPDSASELPYFYAMVIDHGNTNILKHLTKRHAGDGDFIKLIAGKTAERGDANMLSMVLGDMDDISIQDPQAHILKSALRSGDAQKIDLVLAMGADIEAADSIGRPVMLCAAPMCDIGMLEKLMKSGAQILKRDPVTQETYLHACAYGQDNESALKLGMEHGVDPTVPDIGKWTFADRAASTGNRAALEIAKKQGVWTAKLNKAFDQLSLDGRAQKIAEDPIADALYKNIRVALNSALHASLTYNPLPGRQGVQPDKSKAANLTSLTATGMDQAVQMLFTIFDVTSQVTGVATPILGVVNAFVQKAADMMSTHDFHRENRDGANLTADIGPKLDQFIYTVALELAPLVRVLHEPQDEEKSRGTRAKSTYGHL